MNFMDHVIEYLLRTLDGVLDVVSLGGWSRWQGSKVANVKVKEVK
jgi:Cu/Ag efflux pump CusA